MPEGRDPDELAESALWDDEALSHHAFVEERPIAEATRLVSRYEALPSRAAAVFEDLPPRMKRVLRLCDGLRNLRAISNESDLSRADATLVLEQLIAAGLVARVDGPLPERRALSADSRRWLGLELPGHARDLDFGDWGDSL